LNVFGTGINAVSFLPVAVFMVFLTTAQWRLLHTRSSVLAQVFDCDW